MVDKNNVVSIIPAVAVVPIIRRDALQKLVLAGVVVEDQYLDILKLHRASSLAVEAKLTKRFVVINIALTALGVLLGAAIMGKLTVF